MRLVGGSLLALAPVLFPVRRVFRLGAAWFLFFLAGFAGAQPATGPRVIRVVMDDNYPPFAFKDDAGNLQGITVDQWRLWEAKTGIKVELQGLNWAEALRRMQAGEFDVIDTIFKTDERAAYYDFTKPYARIDVPVFFRRDISGITGLASLKGFPVAAKAGDAAVELLRKNGVTTILLFSNYEAIVTAASEHKVNVFVVDQPPALYYLNKLGIQDEFRMTEPVNVGEFYRAVQKGNTNLLQAVEAGFAALSPVELDQIDQKWYGRDLVPHLYLRWLEYVVAGAASLLALLAAWNWTLTRRVRQRTRELRESQVLLDGVVNHSPSMISVKDLNGRYLLANERLRSIYAGNFKSLDGKTDFDLFSRELAERFQKSDRAVSGGGVPVSVEENLPHPDGIHSYVSVKFPLKDAQGGVFAVAGIATDVTELKRAADEIKRLHADLQHHAAQLEQRVWERTAELAVARDRAEAADRSKSAFLATMSHELRTPLHSIIGFTGIILQGLAGPLNAEQAKQLGMVRNSARHLLALINDVLDISKIEAGEFRVEAALFDLRATIERAVATIRPLADAKRLDLRLEMSPSIGELTSDARRVEQILLNLLNNAVKFTELGEVALVADAVGGNVRLRITDTGIGIKPEDLATLFRPFHQAASGLARSHEGTGLGLAICRRLAGLLGGEIQVESEPGRGSTFTLLLPLRQSSQA